jgi:hypothetical protein
VEFKSESCGVLCSGRNIIFSDYTTGGGEAIFAEFDLALVRGDVGTRFVPALGYVAKVSESLSISVGTRSAVEVDRSVAEGTQSACHGVELS